MQLAIVDLSTGEIIGYTSREVAQELIDTHTLERIAQSLQDTECRY